MLKRIVFLIAVAALVISLGIFAVGASDINGLNSTSDASQGFEMAKAQNKSVVLIFDQDSCVYCAGFSLTLLVLSFLISKIDLEKLISKSGYIPKVFAILIIFGAVYMLVSLF